MISAIDRHFGFSGGESLALITVIALLAWLAFPHFSAQVLDHVRAVASHGAHFRCDFS